MTNLNGTPVPDKSAGEGLSRQARTQRPDRQLGPPLNAPDRRTDWRVARGLRGIRHRRSPGGIASTGSWRISAQMTAPFVSGWSRVDRFRRHGSGHDTQQFGATRAKTVSTRSDGRGCLPRFEGFCRNTLDN